MASFHVFVYCFDIIFGDCRLSNRGGNDYTLASHDKSVTTAVRRQSSYTLQPISQQRET
jgi:hypothetical protein